MKLTHEQVKVCKTLKESATDICCAILNKEEIHDLGEKHTLYTREVTDNSQGDVCYKGPGGKIVELELDKPLESLIRHLTGTIWTKSVIGQLRYMLEHAEPYVVGTDPEQEGRVLIGVDIARYDFDDAAMDISVAQWFGKVSVDERLVDTHLKNANVLEWWFKHSPSTKSPKKDSYSEAFDVINSKA